MHFRQLNLLSQNITLQYEFYRNTIGLECEQTVDSSFSIHLPNSKIFFSESKKHQPYHFAFNIPAYSEDIALEWLREKVPIIMYQGKEIVDFKNWNAKSIYFHDRDRNIVEFIGRRNLEQKRIFSFSASSILNISEVGLPVDQIEPVFNLFQQYMDLPIYDGDFDRFCALGFETGLFIVVDKNRKRWFPTDEIILSPNFSARVEHQGQQFNFDFQDQSLNISRISDLQSAT